MRGNDSGRSIGILGGTRFIGYHLARTLLEAGHEVTVFHRGRTAPPGPLASSRLRHVYGDRDRPADLRAFIEENYDAVFDLSGYTPRHVEPLVTDEARVRIGHYVFCSTSSVYAVPPPCPHAEDAPRTSASRTYGGDKALVEDLLLDEWRRSGWPVTIVRPQGVFGLFEAPQAAWVFSRLTRSLPIVLGGRRGYRINFLYVSDLTAMFTHIACEPRAHGKVYNIAGDDVVTQLEFVELCSAVAALSQPADVRVLEEEDSAPWPSGMPWLDHDLVADNSRIKRELGIGFTPLQRALEETLAWLRTTGSEALRDARPISVWRKVLGALRT